MERRQKKLHLGQSWLLKWTVEEAITTPVLTRSECGKKAKEASPWSKLVIPSREEMMQRRKLTYIAN
ncbi:hypothetical protein [Bacillus thuringiensis]|uniref:hypothetical protein n=1 Tax=Bacillus thuringiensis TaxID=1428 RepID=UPI0020C8B519|nr:hypothetical protein [Bacillus thuringiensis]